MENHYTNICVEKYVLQERFSGAKMGLVIRFKCATFLSGRGSANRRQTYDSWLSTCVVSVCLS